MKLFQRPCLLIALALLAALPTHAATDVVTSSADDGRAGTLRMVIANANAGDVITFTNTLSAATILLTAGELLLNKNLTIDGSVLPNGINIDGNNTYRGFEIASGVTNVFVALTISNGFPFIVPGGGILINPSGGLSLTNCTLSNNSTFTAGGDGIFNQGLVILNQCTLSGNYSYTEHLGGGGGIENYGTAILNQCTLFGNQADDSDGGGGILNYGILNLTNSIVAGNTNNGSEDNITGSISTAGGVNLTSGDPLLAPLGNYGGPTQTMPPLSGSPALDACTNGTSFITDQRGYPRIVGPFADIGAVEADFHTVVNTLADGGYGSLRQIILNVTNGSTITFSNTLAGGTILLTNAAGELLLNKNLSIDASALTNGITIDGNNTHRVFEIARSVTNVFIALTITNGNHIYDPANGGGPYDPIYGGGGILINPSGNLSLTNCTVSCNHVSDSIGIFTVPGGGIENFGTLTVNQSTLSNNYADYIGYGGGIYNQRILTMNQSTLSGNHADYGGGRGGGGIENEGTLTINQSTLSSNHTDYSGGGGGIANNYGTVTINHSTLSGNHADYSYASGGGIANYDTVILNQCTLSGNHADYSHADYSYAGGGGIYNFAAMTLNQSTLSGNHADNSGGGGGIKKFSYSYLNLTNSIVAGNAVSGSEDNISGSISTAGGVNITSGNPQLAPLANYGGPTQTMPPIPDSPAVDGCTNGTSFLFDQRGIGFPRIVGAYADIGAVEAISYYIYAGNGNTNYGGAVGQGQLILSDDGTNITGVMTKGPGNFNDTLVLYIDSTNGGFTNTAGFLDNGDGSRAAISGFGGSVVGTLTFLPDFLPDYAIALGPADNNFGGLWQLANGGENSLIFIASVNLNPIGTATSPTYSFSFNVGQIGVQTNSGATIKILALISTTPDFARARHCWEPTSAYQVTICSRRQAMPPTPSSWRRCPRS